MPHDRKVAWNDRAGTEVALATAGADTVEPSQASASAHALGRAAATARVWTVVCQVAAGAVDLDVPLRNIAMSLMLDALKRIEAKQSTTVRGRPPCRQAERVSNLPPDVEPIELARPADSAEHALEDFACRSRSRWRRRSINSRPSSPRRACFTTPNRKSMQRNCPTSNSPRAAVSELADGRGCTGAGIGPTADAGKFGSTAGR